VQRRLGPRATIAVVAGIFVVGVGVFLALGGSLHHKAAKAVTVTTTTQCSDASNPYGAAPDGFAYEPVDEATRSKTMKALSLDDSGGRVDMREAKRGGVTLGTIVGVPSPDPGAYVSRIVGQAQAGGVQVTKAPGYAVIPLPDGTHVAIGVRGCLAVLISSQDPNGVTYLATAVLGTG
jgi:hypothetical protein